MRSVPSESAEPNAFVSNGNSLSPDAEPVDQAEFAERPNKAEGKRETEALRELSTQLAELPASRLAALPLSERACDALAVYQRIRPKAHGGRRRQMQLIIKIMRHEDMTAIADNLSEERNNRRANSLEKQGLVDVRTEILASDEALEAFIAQHQLSNEFRTLARKARREQKAGDKSQAQRALLRALQRVFLDPANE